MQERVFHDEVKLSLVFPDPLVEHVNHAILDEVNKPQPTQVPLKLLHHQLRQVPEHFLRVPAERMLQFLRPDVYVHCHQTVMVDGQTTALAAGRGSVELVLFLLEQQVVGEQVPVLVE